MNLIIKLVINAAAIWVAAKVIDGISLSEEWLAILLVVVVFALVNAFIKPIINFLSMPAKLLTLGLFTLVINAAMLALTAGLTTGLDIAGIDADGTLKDGFINAFLGALLVSIVSIVLNRVLTDDD